MKFKITYLNLEFISLYDGQKRQKRGIYAE